MNSLQVERAAELLSTRSKVRELLAHPPLGVVYIGYVADSDRSVRVLLPDLPWGMLQQALERWDELYTEELKALGLKED